MSKQKVTHEDTVIKNVALVGTISLISMMLLFMIITIFSTNSLVSQIRLLTEHPFTVNGDVSDVKTNLALMRICTERLQSYNQPEDIEDVRISLDELYIEMESLLEEIEELYLGPDEHVVVLKDTYGEIQKAHSLFLDFAKLDTSTTDVIAEYEEKHLYNLYNKFDENATQILTTVRNNQQNIFNSAEKMSGFVAVWSFIIIVATIIGLIFFQWAIRKMSKKIYQKNRQFEMLSDTIDETFLIFEKGNVECDFVSGSAGRVLGVSSDSLQKDYRMMYKYMDADTEAEICGELNNGEKTLWEKVIAYHNPHNAQPGWMQMSIYRVGENGDTKYIMTFTDITEERRANQALQDALASAQKANNAKKDFLSRMSHEIRTPMNAIIGMTTIAAASMEDRRKVEDCLEKISYSSKHLLMLINDVLDMSRIESNRISINAEPFELYQFINTFVSVVYPQACENGLEFTEKIRGFSENTTYLGDTLRLNQILLNLTSNAIKFTPRGGKVSLSVSLVPSRSKKIWIRFVVSDTGIGMDEQGLSKLYTPFEQANASIASKYGGTGLGMPITQNLVSLMGGHIKVKSKLGEGTTFTVELPFEQSSVGIQPLRAEALEELEVLVVDDEIDICEHTVLLLEKMKIHAEWVLSGAEAVEQVIAAQNMGKAFDVCFIDWRMPGMDGVETTRRIRAEVGPDTPIIIISAYDWSDIEEEARAAGVNAFIAKPMFQSSIYNALVSVTNEGFALIKPKSNVVKHSLEGKCLLLAEDNRLNTEIVVTLLEMSGAIVESVENGHDAVERFLMTEPGHFDAILMDVQMPIMDGCEATRQIRSCGREDARSIPIIATTANAFTEDVATVMAAGMDAHIGKPLDIEQLYNILSKLCGDDYKPAIS